MATRTEVTTETTTQDLENSPHPSQVPHNSGFSTYTPSGYWRRDTRTRSNSRSPSGEAFRGEGRMLRPSSAPPDSSDKKEGERMGTPSAPRIPTTSLPTPDPTGPRTRRMNFPLGGYEPRNYKNLRDEVRAVEPGHTFRGDAVVPESVLEDVRRREMLNNSTSDPRSPVINRTPIPSPFELPPRLGTVPSRRSYESGIPMQSPFRRESESSNGSPIRITEPVGSQDQVTFPSLADEPNPTQYPRSYQEQYDSAMGSALDRDPNTMSSQPKRYNSPRDALEDIGAQCRRFGEGLGVRGISELALEDHVHAVRALAEAREADLPIWAASRTREPSTNHELNRLYDIVRQPDVALIVPEDPTLPDPWELTKRQSSPTPIPNSWSWQQLEQHRAFERESERWRERMAEEVRQKASAVLEQQEDRRPQGPGTYTRSYEPIPRPQNPAVPSPTVYPSSSITSSNWNRPRVKIIEPEEEDRSRVRTEPSVQDRHRDVPPHQTPAYQPLKPGNVRPEGYKYTPFHRTQKTEPTLKQSRRRLREILEDVERERSYAGLDSVNQETPGQSPESNNIQVSMPRTPSVHIQPQPPMAESIPAWGNGIRGGPQSIPEDTRMRDSYGNNISPSKQRSEDERISRLTEEGERIRNWESRGSANNNELGTHSNVEHNNSSMRPSNSAPPPPPPPPSSPPPPAPSPPPPPSNDGHCYNCRAHSTQDRKAHESIGIRAVNVPDEKSTRDAIARESKLEIRKPTAFDGSNRELWRPFLSDCYRMFSAKPTIYSTEQSKVTYASSWFTGAAARYYQNQVEQEMENDLWIPTLHEWSVFVREFGRLFGLHDEVLHAQSSLDKVIQKFGESFADFIVRFEDAALKTLYNDPAKRWRLLLQIRKDLRDRLTLVGRIPGTFDEVVKRLLDIDGAREAFRETGLSVSNPNYQNRRALNTDNQTTSGQSTPNYGNRFKTPVKTQGTGSNTETAKLAKEEDHPKVTTFRISREERDRRMREGLCIRCRGKGHFGKECTIHEHTVVGKCCFEWEHSGEEEPEELLYAIDDNGDFHQIEGENSDRSDATPDTNEEEQGNGEGARDLEEGKN
ncbi:hypothetical protein K435DRAFT_872123 [Dendrothele bispora CBS 962.96]|uniref:CCHC-type domain-containing protein n=1 Tax=Dendrothele bispora (strain CBS 962.96) TaxID=1314807 RepID=A0A4V4HCC9_DENBC|nr:hypothetical protein K435DRAFT_872123 [Dendrothele bispora CBS 962.96]